MGVTYTGRGGTGVDSCRAHMHRKNQTAGRPLPGPCCELRPTAPIWRGGADRITVWLEVLRGAF